MRVLRLSAYLFVVCSALAALGARSVLADVEEAALLSGKEMARFSNLAGPAEVIQLNGARLHHASVYRKESVREVLDAFEQHCRENPGLLAGALELVPASAKAKLDPKIPAPDRAAILRDENDSAGMVACLVGGKPGSLEELKEKLVAFKQTKDISSFGKLRYVYAEKAGDETHVLTLWADAGLNVGAMFPGHGDAAGSDSANVPRPPDARRVLSASAEGMPFGVRTYASTRNVENLRGFYREQMRTRGFEYIPEADHEGTAAYMRENGNQVFVSIGAQGRETYVTLTESHSDAAPSTATIEAE